MTLNEATERAQAIWADKEIAVWREQVGSGAYVQVNGDERMHRLDHNGHVACRHAECLAAERRADFGNPEPDRKIGAMRYAVVIERGSNGISWGAHVPDLPGCAAVGRTQTEARTLIREAIVAHVERLRETGQGVPEATTMVAYMEAER